MDTEDNNQENTFMSSKYEQLLSAKKKAKGFRAFNLQQNILEAILRIGYKFPTPIQRKTIPEIISGFNVIAHSRTGSGKTAAFLIPIMNRLKEHSKIVGCRCLILSPTRELAHQTLSFCKKLGKGTNLRYTLLVGGNELEGQFEKLATNPDIIIATPGRVMHHLNEGSLDLKKVEILAVDEADKIFELNFEEQLKLILKSCPPSRQVLLFSATIPQQLALFMKTGIREYKLINIDEENKIPDKLKIHLISTRTEEKKFALVSLLLKNSLIDLRNQSTMIFVATKYHCEFLNEFLKLWKIKTLFIYGQMDQDLRDQNLDKFRKKNVNVLIVTDVAARGLDIPLLDNVINYDFPDSIKLFIHRVGRTARAGKEGQVFNLITPNDFAFFFDFKVSLGKQLSLHSDVSSVQSELKDYNKISIGTIPQSVINLVKETREDFLNFKIDIEALEDSANKALTKAADFKQKPSKYGIKQAKKLITLQSIQPHPMFVKSNNLQVIKDEIEKNEFLNQLKNFKPKESYFERVNETNVKEEIIKDFKNKANDYKKKKEIEKMKDKMLREKIQNEDDDMMDEPMMMKHNKNKNSLQVDEVSDEDDEDEMPRKNKNLVNVKPQQKNEFLGKKIKRSQIKDFKNNSQYIKDSKSEDNLWGDEKPITLDELTLNFVPDDDHLSNKKKLVWDPKKKNFVKSKVDREGKIIRTNEAGVKVKSKDKNPHAYKNWQKKNKLRVQKTGEMENERIATSAGDMFRERKISKGMRQKAKNQAQGQPKPNGGKFVKSELKTFDQLLKSKKDKFKKSSNKNFSKRDAKMRQISQTAHQNRRSMALVKRRRK
jgi:ATP-dependent RNA helicase DDX54/DBP10